MTDELKDEELVQESENTSLETSGQIIETYDPVEVDDTKGIKRLFKKMNAKVRKLWNKFIRTKFVKYILLGLSYIGKGFYYLFYPLVLFKKKVYDKMTHAHQKLFVAFMFLTPVLLGFLIFYLYPLILSLICIRTKRRWIIS